MSAGVAGLCFLPSKCNLRHSCIYQSNSWYSRHRRNLRLLRLHLVRWVPRTRQSPQRKLDKHRRVPPSSTRLHRRPTIRHLALLGRLDIITKHPLGRPLPLRNPLRHGLPVDLHGHAQLPHRRLRNPVSERPIRRQLYTKHLRCRPPSRCEAYVPYTRRELGLQSYCLSQPRCLYHSVRVYPLRR